MYYTICFTHKPIILAQMDRFRDVLRNETSQMLACSLVNHRLLSVIINSKAYTHIYERKKVTLTKRSQEVNSGAANETIGCTCIMQLIIVNRSDTDVIVCSVILVTDVIHIVRIWPFQGWTCSIYPIFQSGVKPEVIKMVR